MNGKVCLHLLLPHQDHTENSPEMLCVNCSFLGTANYTETILSKVLISICTRVVKIMMGKPIETDDQS